MVYKTIYLKETKEKRFHYIIQIQKEKNNRILIITKYYYEIILLRNYV